MTREMLPGANSSPPGPYSRNASTSAVFGGEMAPAQLEPDTISDDKASYEDKPNGTAPVPILEPRAVAPELTISDHASPTPTYLTSSARAPPVISPPPPKSTEFDFSKILDATMRQAAEKAAAKAMKLWKKVKDYEKVVKDWEKVIEKTEREKLEKGNKEKRKSATQPDREVERLRLEEERMEKEERRLVGAPELHAYSGQVSLPPPSPSPSPATSPTQYSNPML